MFLSSHEEKRACLSLSVGGQSWSELELHGRQWGAHRRGRGGGRGRGRGRGGAARGMLEEGLGALLPARATSVCSLDVSYVHEEENSSKEEGEEKEKKKNNGKFSKLENFQGQK
jgi:hypothetical protein